MHGQQHNGATFLARSATLLLVSIASIVGAGALIWAWLDPETVRAAPTSQLLGLLALLFLPVCTLTLIRFEARRLAHHGPINPAAPAAALADPPTPSPAAILAQTVIERKPDPAILFDRAHIPHTHGPVHRDFAVNERRRRTRSAPGSQPAALHR